MIGNLKAGLQKVGELLEEIKKEFGGGNNKLRKVAELRQIEQGDRMIEEYV